MKTIVIADEAMDIVRNAATLPFQQTATKLPGNCWFVPVSPELVDRIVSVALPGETMSDTIIRVTRAAMVLRPN